MKHMKRGLKNNLYTHCKGALVTTSIFSGAFIISIMAASIFAPASRSNADTLIFEDQDSGYTASVSSANTIELDVAATTGGTLARAHDTVNIVTDNPEGYTLYLSMNNVSDYSVSKPGNALYLDGNSTSTSFINPTSGTSSEPSSLGTNEWGYSLADNLAFSKVPLRSNPDTVATSDSATTAEGDNLDVYYGVNVNSALPTGSYTGVVNYSVLSDYSGESSDKAGVFPGDLSIDSADLEGATINISTNLYTTKTFQNNEVSVLIGESGQEQACTITEVSTASGQLTVTCALPNFTFPDYGDYTLPVTLSVPSYNKTYTGMTLTIHYEEPFPCEANAICYAPNGDNIDGTMDNQTTVYHTSTDWSVNSTALSSSVTELTLYSPNFARPGYGFAGWNTKRNGTGTTYGPNQALRTSDGTLTPEMQSTLGTSGIVLYAKWVASAGDMQDWSGCSSMNIGDVTALTDNRADSINTGKTYAVAKLADGKCWMIENLRYAGTGTSTNSWVTDRPANYQTLKQYNFTNITMPDTNKSPTDNIATGSRWYSYGNYYSWPAAVDSTTLYSSGQTAPAPGICPAGWRVPSSNGASTDYGGLYYLLNNEDTTITSNNLRTYPNNYVFSGYWTITNYNEPSKATNRGVLASYWSSVASNITSSMANAYVGLNFWSSSAVNASENGNFNRFFGMPVRCVTGS